MHAVKIERLEYKRIGCGRGGVVGEAEPVPVTTPPFVEDTLITTIPRWLRLYQLMELLEFLVARSANQNTRVENIWPTNIGGGRKFVGNVEEMRNRTNWKDVGIEKNYLLELC